MKKSIAAIALLVASTSVNAEWWDLSWVNPTEREDNTAYDHATDGGSTLIYNIVDATIRATLAPSVTHYEENFPPGCYGVALTAKDADGRESVWSTLKEWCVLANPKPMTEVKVVRRALQ